MTNDIFLVTFILVFALLSFIAGKLRVDVTAMIVLCFLAITGLVSPHEAFAAFGNPAIITIWAMYILSAGLVKTNIAAMIGKNVIRFSGRSEIVLTILIMTVSGFLSAFMNNIGVAALMLPVVMSVSGITGHLPSKLLLPMVCGSLLGGSTTMLSTINILVSNALRENNYTPFGLFDFTPVGIFTFTSGILFLSFIGKRFLPKRDLVKEFLRKKKNLNDLYELQERMSSLRVPRDSLLINKTISEINIDAVMGLTVLSIVRSGRTILAPDPSTRLAGNDVVIIEGRLDRLNEFRSWQRLQIEKDRSGMSDRIFDGIKYAEVIVGGNSPILNKSYYEIEFRKNYGINVFAIQHGSMLKQGNLASHIIQNGDVLFVRGKEEHITALSSSDDFTHFTSYDRDELMKKYSFREKLYVVQISGDSAMIGKTLSASRMGAVFGLHVLAIIRGEDTIIMPTPDEIIRKNDKLVIGCRQEDLDLLHGIQELIIETESAAKIAALESEQVGLAEVAIAPRSSVVGKTLLDLNFRTKYGMQVIAIWHQGKIIRTNLRDIKLDAGDALLLMGKRENIKVLKDDSDFIVLTPEVYEVLNKKMAPVSGGIMLIFVVTVLMGWLPVSTAALSAVVLMIVTGCLSIDDAYKAIDWKAVFLIAGMMPLGITIHRTGMAELASTHILYLQDTIGNWGILVLLYLIITASGAVIPTSALVVFMAPVFLSISRQLGVSPHSVMMVLAVSASASFISPVSHPANVLVMGPGGYRFSDYTKVGLPLTIVVMTIGLMMISVFWPLQRFLN